MTAVLDGWWWPSAVGEPGELATEQGVRGPSLEDSLDRLVAHLRSAGRGLRDRSSADVAQSLGRVGTRFQEDLLGPSAALVSSESGLSLPMATRVVAGMAKGWTGTALTSLLQSEFPEGAVLDEFTQFEGGSGPPRKLRAYGRGFSVHIGSGSVPGVTVTSLIRGLIVKCPSLVKPGLGDIALTVAFLRALHEEDPDLATAAAALYWPGGAAAAARAEKRLFQEADQVIVYGGNETVDRIRSLTPAGTPMVVHPHRVGVVVAGPGAKNDVVAEAICMFDQRGCVSPQIILYLGEGPQAAQWAASLATDLSRLERELPPGEGSAEALSAVHQLRGALELRQAAGEGVRVVYDQSESWSVIVAPLEDVRPVGLRTSWIVPTPTALALSEALNTLGPVLQSVGLIGDLDPMAPGDIADLATQAGASRVVPVASLAFPEAEWLHDGQRPLRELVRWAASG